MLIAVALAVGLFRHHHPKDKPTQHEATLAKVQADVEEYEASAIDYATRLKQDSPNIPQLYFDAIENDIKKLAADHAGDSSFVQDFNDLEADVDSLSYASRFYAQLDNA